LAIQQDNVPLMRLLLSHGARDRSSQSPLILAVQKGRLDMVQPLLDGGCDASARDSAGRSALLIAYTAMQVGRSASASETSLTGSGSGQGPEENPKRTEQLAILRLLIRYGADVKTTDPSGTPLVATVMRDGDATIFKLFVDGGADLNAAAAGRGAAGGADGETLLLHAIDRRPADLVRILIDHGANINAADKKGRTPLVTAMARGRWDIVRLLVMRGADVSQLGAVAPAALARACGEQTIVDLLVAKGAVAGDALEFDEEAGALERVGSTDNGRERRVLRKGRGRG
jgi:ankyrin repeat protein